MGTELSSRRRGGLSGACAVVVTHRRPRLAADTVRLLVDLEGFAPEQVVVVVNGEGGLDDPDLEKRVRMVRLADNGGPALGFRRGLIEAFGDPSVRWAYLCEDDMALLGLPAPRVAGLLERVALASAHDPVGAVVAFGRVFEPQTGHTRVFVPRRGLPGDLAPVDVGVWGAALVSRQVFDAGILPDPQLFFGFEDFDFFCALRQGGFSLLVDALSARKAAGYQTLAGRDERIKLDRPVDAEEPWRAYYVARNFFALARRHGRRRWLAWHMLFSLRRLQLAAGGDERMAIVHGLLDGARGRLGAHPGYRRALGEREHSAAVDASPEAPDGSGAPSDLAGHTLAMVLSHNAPLALRRCLAAIDAQSVRPAAVLVVDNASEPPVDLRRRPPGSTPVTVVRSEDNLGPAGGWAVAFEEFVRRRAPLAWVLDDDIVPDPDCLEVLLSAAVADPERAFFFPRAVQPDGSVGEWGSWCGFVVARPVVERAGVPRADLFWWAEDNEFTQWRIPQAGYARRIVDGAVVQHDAIRQNGSVPTWKYYYEARNMLFLHLHLMRRVGWYPRNVSKLVGRALVRERGRWRLRSLAAVGRGLWDGARGRLGLRYPVTPMRERKSPTASAPVELAERSVPG